MFPPNSEKNDLTIHSNTLKPHISKRETNWKTASQSQQNSKSHTNSVGRITISCSPGLNFNASEFCLWKVFLICYHHPQIPIQFDFFGGNMVGLKLVWIVWFISWVIYLWSVFFHKKIAKGDDGAKNAMRSPHIPQEMLSEESVVFNKLFSSSFRTQFISFNKTPVWAFLKERLLVNTYEDLQVIHLFRQPNFRIRC